MHLMRKRYSRESREGGYPRSLLIDLTILLGSFFSFLSTLKYVTRIISEEAKCRLCNKYLNKKVTSAVRPSEGYTSRQTDPAPLAA